MAATVLLLLAVACSEAVTVGLTADYGRLEPILVGANNTSLTQNSLRRINSLTSHIVYKRNLRIFNGTKLNGDVNRRAKRDEEDNRLRVGENKRVKRDGEEDRCAAFKYTYQDQEYTSIWHPHSKDNPNGANNYYGKINCVTVISGTEGSVLELTFVDLFGIEYHPECAYDYLEIRDGDRGYAPLLGGKKLCGRQFPKPIVTSGPYAWVKFHSDDVIEDKGFHIKVAVKPSAKSYVVPDSCDIKLSGMHGVLNKSTINQKCLDDSANQALDVLWTIEAEPNHQIFLNFTEFKLAEPNNCTQNLVQVFGTTIEFDYKLRHYCGSIASPMTTKPDTSISPVEEGNILHVRLYTSKAAKAATVFSARFAILRPLENANTDECNSEEFDCKDGTCVAKALMCDGYVDCKLKADEEEDLCKAETDSPDIFGILLAFSMILSLMLAVSLFKCFMKIYQDQKIINENLRQALENKLDTLSETHLSLDPKRLERDSESRTSLERDGHINGMFTHKGFSKHKLSSINLSSEDDQENLINLEEEPLRRDAEVLKTEDITFERNGKSRLKDLSKKEESMRSKRGNEDMKDKKEINDVHTLDVKEFGCQTRDSLLQSDPPPSSDGSGSNSHGFSTFGYSGATIVRPSPPQTTASEIRIEVQSDVTEEPVEKQKITLDRRPMSTETTRSAPDVIIVSKFR